MLEAERAAGSAPAPRPPFSAAAAPAPEFVSRIPPDLQDAAQVEPGPPPVRRGKIRLDAIPSEMEKLADSWRGKR